MGLDTLASLAGGARALAQAERLATSGALSHLRCEDLGPRLTGRWQGSGELPYRVTIELGRRPTRHACTCPSRQRPCKHVLALLARWAHDPAAFERHGQLDAFATSSPTGPAVRPPAPMDAPAPAGSRCLECIRRYRERQALGLQLSERLLVGWVTEGFSRLNPSAPGEGDPLQQLEGLHLDAVAGLLRALHHTAQSRKGDPGALEEVLPVQLGRAWTLIRRGQAWASAVGSGEEAPGNLTWQEEAALQSALGRRWTAAELRLLEMERDVTVVELAWRRSEDPGLRARVESSLLYDLQGGGWMVERKVTPWSRLGQARPKASYAEPLEVRAAQVWPSVVGRPDAACPRVRWSPGAAHSRPGTPSDWERVLEAARPLSAIRSRHEALRAAPWHAPVVHPELLQVQSIGRAQGQLWVRDPRGEQHALHGPPEALATLSCAGLPPETRAAVVEVREGDALQAPTLGLLALITPRGPVRLAG